MTTITTRAGKGSPLSWTEVDDNFTNLNNDKAENTAVALKAPIASPTFTGTVAGITKTMVGLGNVDNTSDATKDAATATLTNKTITSPKIKAGQFGDSSTATNNFTITAEAADGTMKLARGNAGATTQDLITVDASGKLAFPTQGQNLATAGYVKLPGGLILQWGFDTFTYAGTTITFPTGFTTACLCIVGTANGSSPVAVGTSIINTTTFTGYVSSGPFGIRWFALGY